MNLIERDRKLIWHPFTQEQTSDYPTLIKKGKGSYLFDEKDNKILDLISSWWVNIHGHARPEIARAIYEQASNLEHVIFAGFTHEAAITLCEKFATVLPAKLSKYFFSDNGSTAVEVALKMSYQYWTNKDVPKTIFVCLDGAYHGDTFGAMSVGKSRYHVTFSRLLFPVLSVPFPDTWMGDERVESKEEKSLRVLEMHLRAYPSQIAALIVEPLVQGSSGMRMCRPRFIRELVTLARRREILVIFDEVMTGFGRTGTLFAYEQCDVVPDFLCVSKGITGGFLPLALTVTTEDVYKAFLANTFDKALAHGHSYTANATSCAAAIASFEILTKPETTLAIRRIHEIHADELVESLKTCKNISRGRITGTIAAFELAENVDVEAFRKRCYENGILIRPLRSTVYILPPYCITEFELRNVYKIMVEILNTF